MSGMRLSEVLVGMVIVTSLALVVVEITEIPLYGGVISAPHKFISAPPPTHYRRSTRRFNVRRVRLREISRMALFRALLE